MARQFRRDPKASRVAAVSWVAGVHMPGSVVRADDSVVHRSSVTGEDDTPAADADFADDMVVEADMGHFDSDMPDWAPDKAAGMVAPAYQTDFE